MAVIFEFDWEDGENRKVWWLGGTDINGDDDEFETDNIYEQIAAHEAHLDEY